MLVFVGVDCEAGLCESVAGGDQRQGGGDCTCPRGQVLYRRCCYNVTILEMGDKLHSTLCIEFIKFILQTRLLC